MQVNDTELTHDGFDTAPWGRICVIACGALAKEILDILNLNNLSHVTLRCLPAILHNSPEKITDAVADKITQARADGFEDIYIGYADCGTGGMLQALCDREAVTMLDGAHCYAFFQGVDAAAAQDDVTSFFLTDFLARQFDAFVWKPLGLDRHPELLPMYFGHYTKLVYLEQIPNAQTLAKAQACAERMNLEFEHRPTGYGDLAQFIKKM